MKQILQDLRNGNVDLVAEVAAFVSAVEKGGPPPIPFDEIVEVTKATFDVARMLKDGKSRS